ncbi:DUF192 domain-containing protein [Thioalkalivibrio sulfidiphilus]|uniref:DUF192 domain-containing protein n=1 Tax=Thioalkalivibrio sulfidiphilus TaxID=1033854 RepID=UPI000374F571|nr:DUF192 domain-containing protein [Thioalkalivibrio sulfidiphilus]
MQTCLPTRLARLAVALLAVGLLASLAGARQPQGLPQTGLAVIELRIGERSLTAEVADTEATRRHGLMFRESLPENHGMLFVWDEPARYAMWMFNTPLPLSVAFIDAEGRIANIAHMQPHSTRVHEAVREVRYALEMEQGWFERHSIGAGDRVLGLP